MTIITESEWVSYFGFQRFPFDRPEAGNEEFARPDFLASCFVEPKSFERVFGQADAPVTSLLFAARGTGKTACRVMMDYYCRNGFARLSTPRLDEPSYVLSVPHIRMDNVRNLARQYMPNNSPPEILVEYHAIEIMRQAVPVFVDLVAQSAAFTEKLRALGTEFEDLRQILGSYPTYLSAVQREYLRSLDVDVSLPWETASYRQELPELSLLHIERWSRLIHKLGIVAMYVLVDGIDELMESAQDPQYAHMMIRPLLTHMKLMDGTPYLAMKFFLPSDQQPIIESDPAFRRDRGFVIQRIQWRDEDLVTILRERLNMLRPTASGRDRTAAGFDALCVPELRGEIESNLARNAGGNPRYLMNLCAQMVAAHCAREIENQDDPFQLNREDYFNAVEVVKFRYEGFASILPRPDREQEQPAKHLEQEPAIFEKGQMINDKYEVRRPLPPGAAGQVYCVYDDVFERMCALKVFNNSAVSADSFRNEARSLLRISHPNIVRVYDWGVLRQTGRFYLVSEFVDGKELTGYTLPGNLLPLPEAIRITLELLSALEYLHPNLDRMNELRRKMQEGEIEQAEYEEFSMLNEQGLFHRDIKPSNIILSPTCAKLIDFNIAAKAITAGQTYTGTEGYMLPETGIMRWSADGDLFAAGIVFYELVTGHHPYSERQPMADTLPASPLAYVPELDPQLAGIMLRAVSCDAQVRYHSARQFRQDLLQVEAGSKRE